MRNRKSQLVGVNIVFFPGYEVFWKYETHVRFPINVPIKNFKMYSVIFDDRRFELVSFLRKSKQKMVEFDSIKSS